MEIHKIGNLSKYFELNHIPMNCMLELTYNCNFKCNHCYVKDSPNKRLISFDDVKKIINNIKQLGSLKLTITGGEPTVHPKLADILYYARDNNLVTSLFTNGSNISQELIKALQYSGTEVNISLYGGTYDQYQKVTGDKNNYYYVYNNIEKLLLNNIPVVLKTIATKATINDLNIIYTYAQEKGLKLYIETLVRPTLERDMLDEIKLPNDIMKDVINRYMPSTSNPRKFSKWCGAGTRVICISPTGDLYPCTNFRISLGNVLHNNISDLLNNSEFIKYVTSPNFDYRVNCKECEIHDRCIACPGLWYTANMDLHQPWTYNCEIAKLKHNMSK